jgi:hypothetical protein
LVELSIKTCYNIDTGGSPKMATISLQKKVRICDYCGEELHKEDNWHKCFVCKKDICDNCRVLVVAKRDTLSDTGFFYSWICQSHLPDKFHKYMDSSRPQEMKEMLIDTL